MSAIRLLPPFDRGRLVHMGVGAWLLLSAAGLWMLFQYASTPGAFAAATGDWPSDSSIARATDAPTLVMFAHPHCPCTRASLAELERVVAQSGGAVKPHIIFSVPAGATESWGRTEMWDRAARVPGAILTMDANCQEARRFHAGISGTTLLYDTNGKLMFQGGITAGRGHQGDNAGESAVVSLLQGGSSSCREAPAFGCPLQTSVTTVQVNE